MILEFVAKQFTMQTMEISPHVTTIIFEKHVVFILANLGISPTKMVT
jgi:tRNA A58 N-methylase Trm61